MGTYIKAAFTNRWNLLLLAGGAGYAALSKQPEVWFSLLLAAETAYLGFVATHPRFRKYIDVTRAQQQQSETSAVTQRTAATIMKALPPAALQRFENLRNRCRELQQITEAMRDPTRAVSPSVLEETHLAGLDRLLWIYLRLLFTQYSLERFFRKTSKEDIESEISKLTERLERASKLTDPEQKHKFTRTIQDSLDTCHTRLSNYAKARANYELILLEINRLENKIQSLSELAVNRQEPEFITSQVDQVATSMFETEKTMNDLQFATGILQTDDPAPPLLKNQQTA